MGKQETLETIWEPYLDELPGTDRTLSSWRKTRPKPGATFAPDPRQLLNGIIFRLPAGANVTDCRKSLGTTAPFIAPYQRWVGTRSVPNVGSPRGAQSWIALLGMTGGINGAMGKARLASGTCWAQPYGPWQGWYHSAVADGEGGPLSWNCGTPNVHDAKLLEASLDAIVRTTKAHPGGTPYTVSGPS